MTTQCEQTYSCVCLIKPVNQSYFMLLQVHLKSLGPIDRKLHGHGENDGFVLCEYII